MQRRWAGLQKSEAMRAEGWGVRQCTGHMRTLVPTQRQVTADPTRISLSVLAGSLERQVEVRGGEFPV